MIEKYFYIEPDEARRLVQAARNAKAEKRGFERRAYLFGEYAVLSASRLKLRNVTTRDDDFVHLDDLIGALMELKRQGVGVVPIYGYCCDEGSPDGTGYIIEQRAAGEEMYDDAILVKLEVWARRNPSAVYLSSDKDASEYVVSRTEYLAEAPQAHFDGFIRDVIAVMERDILIDFGGKSNFFYDVERGFQFIDLDSHTDYRYGLTGDRPDSREMAALCGFAPCHLAEGSRAFGNIALADGAIAEMGQERTGRLARANLRIFEKCRLAMRNNRISETQIDRALERLSILGR